MDKQIEFLNWRARSVWRSFKVLYNLPPSKVEAFIDSYGIYNFDWKDEEALIEKMGPDYYKEMKKRIIDWYSVINHLCSLGEVEKMYIPPVIDTEASITKNQKLFERQLCKDLGIGKGDRVLDIGCGRGCIAMHMASLSGANILGINIDHDQLATANFFAKRKGLSTQCEFRFGDMNDIPFPYKDNSFNSVYQIQAFSISKDLQKLFNEIYRILKPGGKFGALDWVALPGFDPNNEYHQQLMSRVKPLVGAIGTPYAKEYVQMLENAGFEVMIKRNLSVDGLQELLINKADVYFNRLWKAVKLLVKCKVLPEHFDMMFQRLTQDGQAFVEADRLGLVTTSYYIIAKKPDN